MMSDNPQNTLARMEAMLRRCRRRIMLAEVSARLRQGLDVYLKSLLVVAGLFLVLRALAYAVGMPETVNWMHLISLAVILGVVTFGYALFRGVWGNPVHVTGAAERLDLSQVTHNRIATAIALLRSGDDSQFAQAAICDGFEHLEKLQSEQPHVELSTTSWRRMGICLVISLTMALAGQFLQAGPRPADRGDPATTDRSLLAKTDSAPEQVIPDIKPAPSKRTVSRGDRRATGDIPPRDDDIGQSDTGQRAERGKESRSEGPAGRHAAGKSRTSQSSSDSRSAASGAGGKSEPGKSEPGKNKKPRRTKKPTAGQPKVQQKNQKGGSINARGSSGSGSMRTAQNEWSSKVKAKSGDNDDFEQEEEPDEEMDPDKQRLGAQPALKSRTSRLSRELSLSMGTGLSNDMMKGRGGPGAQKKARGVATMIMGVPVPGFVKGRLLPGPTKSTQEEVEPSPRQGDYAAASELQQARPEEAWQERYRPLAAMCAQARDYLIKYHAENKNRKNGAATNE
jgi:hypothetical protein